MDSYPLNLKNYFSKLINLLDIMFIIINLLTLYRSINMLFLLLQVEMVTFTSELLDDNFLIDINWRPGRKHELLTFAGKMLGEVEGGGFAAVFYYAEDFERFRH